MLSPGAAQSLFLGIRSGPWLVPTAASARHLGQGSPGLRARSSPDLGAQKEERTQKVTGKCARRPERRGGGEGQPKLSQPHSQ